MKKIPRNSLCPCNSGLKYKRCCLKNNEVSTMQSSKSDLLPEDIEWLKISVGPKVSKRVLDIAYDSYSTNDSEEQKKFLLTIGALAWNSSLTYPLGLDRDKAETSLAPGLKMMDSYNSFSGDCLKDFEKIVRNRYKEAAEEHVDYLIKVVEYFRVRKEVKYPNDKRFIMSTFFTDSEFKVCSAEYAP